MICKGCNTQNLKQHKFCFECGASLSDKKSSTLLSKNEADKLLRLSSAFEINELVDKAIVAYTAILEVNPNYADVHYKLGSAYEAKGMVGKALSEYKEAIHINPNFIEAHRKLGELYIDEGLYDEAVKEFKRVLSVKVRYRYADVHNNMGVAYEKGNRLAQAIKCYQKAISINPRYGKARYNLGNAYLATEQYAEAVEDLVCLNNLGIALSHQRKYQLAAKTFKEAVSLEPGYTVARYNLANVYEHLNQYDLAKEQYKAIIKIDPLDQEAVQALKDLKPSGRNAQGAKSK